MNTFLKVILMLLAACVLTTCGKEEEKSDIGPDLVFTGNNRGCGNFVMFRVNSKNTTSVAVMGSREKLRLDKTLKEFDLTGIDPAFLKVEVNSYQSSADGYYCNDVMVTKVTGQWTAVSGKVKLQIIRDSISVDTATHEITYTLNGIIENATLKNAGGHSISLNDVSFKEVFVGFLVP